MLNKTICKQCVNRQFQHIVGRSGAWCSYDDRAWNVARIVSCRFHGVEERLDKDIHGTPVDEPPPKWCPFSAEHLVSQ